jgi:hypothetical protein
MGEVFVALNPRAGKEPGGKTALLPPCSPLAPPLLPPLHLHLHLNLNLNLNLNLTPPAMAKPHWEKPGRLKFKCMFKFKG